MKPSHYNLNNLPAKGWLILVITLLFPMLGIDQLVAQAGRSDPPEKFDENARPWTFWYWMQAGVSREGILADLEAMKEIGLAGAYLMPIQGVVDPPHIDPPVEQLSPEFWEMVRYAMEQADRLGLKIGMHACDGFAVAGGPWVTPEQSMQEVVWSRMQVSGGKPVRVKIPQPESKEGFYRDIALYAFPSLPGTKFNSANQKPQVTSSLGEDAPLDFLLDEANEDPLRLYEPGWILYDFSKPVTCRMIRIRPHDRNFQSMRLLVQTSMDGEQFTELTRLEPPRHGWQSMGIPLTYTIPKVTARFFRFVFDPEGSEPGEEDLDFAKWAPNLKVRSIYLSGEPAIHQVEGKNGSVWRVSRRTRDTDLDEPDCVSIHSLRDLSGKVSPDGMVEVDLPEGKWTLLRIGHTSTGHTNATGGAGKGLEIDKFSVEAAELQFDRWFGEAIRQVGPELADRVLKVFHVDSWECSSQNWSSGFEEEFKKRRGYSLKPYLPAIAGIPIESASVSEKFLLDYRKTISELVVDKFFQTMKRKAMEVGCKFSAESLAPTMLSDGMRHFSTVDIPMGEFWMRSPTHDKANDILDAVSGGHVYGKPIIQAEAFTELRMAWDEHPAMLKSLADRHFALGINRLSLHVFVHNPWLDRMPGMTLDGVGLYFQRDQTWWKPGKAWIQYLNRCQELLQKGRPLVDIAVFTGEDLPSRALLPEELIGALPGVIGESRVAKERERLANVGTPMREMPKGVKASANIRDPLDWLDPLNGYKYDSINLDALMRLARVEEGRIILPGGMSYRLLVIPGARRSAPNADILSLKTAERLAAMLEQGARIMFETTPIIEAGVSDRENSAERIQAVQSILGKAVTGPWMRPDFSSFDLFPDLIITGSDGQAVDSIDWTHRTTPDEELYFITNQSQGMQSLDLSFLVSGFGNPVIYNPVTDVNEQVCGLEESCGRTVMSLMLGPGESRFVRFSVSHEPSVFEGTPRLLDNRVIQTIEGPWKVQFEKKLGGPVDPQTWDHLIDWTTHPDPGIQYYSGTATYCTSFDWTPSGTFPVWLKMEGLHNLGTVYLNGQEAGTAWTWPYEILVDSMLVEGPNHLCIKVTNTWANRLMGDRELPEEERITWTTAPYRIDGLPLNPAGLTGPVTLCEKNLNIKKHGDKD